MKIKVLSLLVIYLLNSALSSEQQKQVHHELSDKEFQRIFRRERRDVPNYDFVNITPKTGHRAKREVRPVEFQVNGTKTVVLNLQPAKHNAMSDYAPVWLVKTEQGRQHNYKPVAPEKRKIEGILYEDSKNMATLLAYYRDRKIYYDGVFGESKHSKVIKAVPEDWRNSANGANHFIFDVNSNMKTVSLEPNDIASISDKLDKPLVTFYPKLLVVVDQSLFKLLDRDIQETVKYLSIFWNAVNLKYSKIQQPQIKVMVTGLIVSEDVTAMDCIYKSLNQTNLETVSANKLLIQCGDYFHDEFHNVNKFDNYDAIIVMASLDSGAQVGVAYPTAICTDSGRNIGYIKDDGNFGGVLTATHELGHLLSLPHDGANGCEGYVGEKSTVMAPFTAEVDAHLWSECSIKSLQKFAWDKRASCLEHDHRTRH